ncbi:hypothetical protein QMK33_17305 [Hymenobacter sp. H14-R3]|uniref:hypothetical protein n=1 Tax=Hymenobacter sp. H14-R3 TaxID=3046308 RepID=UPI0024BAA54C|nr:hypothetical protein [Hymenobacter sp. H14-R3]MDJ0366911.1 hypothetical protein [Hymenobacter sp. H14-R3]
MIGRLAPSLLFCLSALGTAAQTSQASFSLPPESVAYRRIQLTASNLRLTDKLSQYAQYDFSSLWLTTANETVMGFIGPGYQRLRLKILTAQRDKADPTRYQVTGKSQVLGYVSAFSGVVVVRQVRELRVLATRTDETVSPARQEGILLADYELREDASQPKSGVFRGVLETNWYLDKQGKLAYDDIRMMSDGFCNNQFVGTWTSYTTKKTLRCNWGDYRIPNSGDFDRGAGEFSPNPKYYTNGWDYFAALYSGNEAARARAELKEKKVWWK